MLYRRVMERDGKPRRAVVRRNRPRKRAEQSRAIATRRAILQAALDEFGMFGFEGANVRRIAQRAGTTHQLISYHFRNKDTLWQEAAAKVLGEALEMISEERSNPGGLDATQLLKGELRKMLDFHFAHPNLHRFLVQESVPGNPRLAWLVNTYLRPIRTSQTALLDAAQSSGGLVPGDTRLIFYLLLGTVAVLPTLAETFLEDTAMTRIPENLVDSYWTILETMLFRPPPHK